MAIPEEYPIGRPDLEAENFAADMEVLMGKVEEPVLEESDPDHFATEALLSVYFSGYVSERSLEERASNIRDQLERAGMPDAGVIDADTLRSIGSFDSETILDLFRAAKAESYDRTGTETNGFFDRMLEISHRRRIEGEITKFTGQACSYLISLGLDKEQLYHLALSGSFDEKLLIRQSAIKLSPIEDEVEGWIEDNGRELRIEEVLELAKKYYRPIDQDAAARDEGDQEAINRLWREIQRKVAEDSVARVAFEEFIARARNDANSKDGLRGIDELK